MHGVLREMNESEALHAFRERRWRASGGTAVCPHCGCVRVYSYFTQHHGQRYRCAGCRKQFTDKSGTIFHLSKLPMLKIMTCVAMMEANPAIPILKISERLEIAYKSAHRLYYLVKAWSEQK